MDVPRVDVETLRTVWKIKQEHPNASIDVWIFQQSCKPGADVKSAAHRAGLLQLVLQMAPTKPMFAAFVEDGQPNDMLFTHFAEMPLEEPGAFNIQKFIPKT